jgi:hypothetical protein
MSGAVEKVLYSTYFRRRSEKRSLKMEFGHEKAPSVRILGVEEGNGNSNTSA